MADALAEKGGQCRPPEGSGARLAHAACSGYKQSAIGRENHKIMLDHHPQTKNLLVSESQQPMGFF